MGVTITYNNKNIKDLEKKITKKKSMVLSVGFLQADVAKIATINEYGATIQVTDKMRALFWEKYNIHKSNKPIIIPPRPFMEMTYNNHKNKWLKILEKLTKEDNYNIEKALSQLGEVITSDIQRTIETGSFVANSQFTQNIKGKNAPLINTGNMRDSVQYEVK